MSMGEALEKANGVMLERKFHQDPVGYVTAMGQDETRFARTMAFMIDRQSSVLAEAITSYFQADPSLCAIRKIGMAGAMTGIWRKADKENFKKEHDGVLDNCFRDDAERYPKDSDEAHGLRVFFREYLKIMPEARTLLSRNFVSFDPLRPSAQAASMSLADSPPMLPILAYLGYSPAKVAMRIQQVIDTQIAATNNQAQPRTVEVDVGMMSWLQGTSHFDLALFERASRNMWSIKDRRMPLLRMLISSMTTTDDPGIMRKALLNFQFGDFETKPAESLGSVLARFSAAVLHGDYGRLNALTRLLQTRLIQLDDIRPLLLSEETAGHVVKFSGFSESQLATTVAKDERLALDRALAEGWKHGAKPAYPGGDIAPESLNKLRKLIRDSLMPLDTAARACMVLGYVSDVVAAVLADPSIAAILTEQALVEPLRPEKSTYGRIIKHLCAENDEAFSERVFARMLHAYRAVDINGAILLNELTTKISAQTLDRYVHELTYTRSKFGSGGAMEPNLQPNNFMLHILDIVSMMPSVNYRTLDRLYEAAEVYWPEFTFAELDQQAKAAQLIHEFRSAPDKDAICPVSDRVKMMEVLSYLQHLNAFEFSDSPFVNQAWEQLIDTFDLKPAELAGYLTHEEGVLSVHKIMIERGLDREFMQVSRSAGRDAMMAADLGL